MRRFLIVFALWTIVAILFAGQLSMDAAYSNNRVTRGDVLVLAFTGWYAWALLSPLVMWLARRFRRIPIHIVLSIAITFAKITLVSMLLQRMGMTARSVSLLVNVPVNLAAYWLIAGATWAIDTRVRAAKLEASLTATRLNLLRTQIQPHFLFNTLHGIAELMHEDVEAADRMITRLSELLRATLETGGAQEVSLRDELSLLQRYIDIQRMRLGERLQFSTEIDARTLDRRVPMLLLQPIVENSVKHAIAERREGGRVSIRARESADRLTIEIEDDGPGFADPRPNGIGLTNVRDRLQHLYGDQQSLHVSSAPGALVRIELPLRDHGSHTRADR